MKRLCRASSLPDAHILRAVLQQAGIDAHVFNENAQGGVGQLPATDAYPEIWLDDEADFARAESVIAEFERAPTNVGVVRCGSCREENPGNFEVCWSCGAAL